jgi:hypothetical protein
MLLRDLLLEKVDPNAKKATSIRKRMQAIRKNISTFKNSIKIAKKKKDTAKVEELQSKIATKTTELNDFQEKLDALTGKGEISDGLKNKMAAEKESKTKAIDDLKSINSELSKKVNSNSTLKKYGISLKYAPNSKNPSEPKVQMTISKFLFDAGLYGTFEDNEKMWGPHWVKGLKSMITKTTSTLIGNIESVAGVKIDSEEFRYVVGKAIETKVQTTVRPSEDPEDPRWDKINNTDDGPMSFGKSSTITIPVR